MNMIHLLGLLKVITIVAKEVIHQLRIKNHPVLHNKKTFLIERKVLIIIERYKQDRVNKKCNSLRIMYSSKLMKKMIAIINKEKEELLLMRMMKIVI